MAAYDRTAGRLLENANVFGGTENLSSLSSAPVSRERLSEGGGEIAVLRIVGGHPSADRMMFALGVACDASIAVTKAGYADPDSTSSDYLFGAVTLGPALVWRTPVFGGRTEARLAVPALALADHEYGDLKEQHGGLDLRLVSPEAWRGLNAAISYTAAAGRRFGLTTMYRIGLVRFDDVQPVRAVSQSFTVGLLTRLGGAMP